MKECLRGLRIAFLGVALLGGAIGCAFSFIGDPMIALVSALGAAFSCFWWLIVEAVACFSQAKMSRRNFLIAAPWAVGLIAASWTQTPLKIAFLIAKPGLDSAAAEIRSGSPSSYPLRAGPFNVVRYDYDVQSPDGLRLVTNDQPTGPNGFCHFTSGVRQGFNPWFEMDLGDGWFYIEED